MLHIHNLQTKVDKLASTSEALADDLQLQLIYSLIPALIAHFTSLNTSF